MYKHEEEFIKVNLPLNSYLHTEILTGGRSDERVMDPFFFRPIDFAVVSVLQIFERLQLGFEKNRRYHDGSEKSYEDGHSEALKKISAIL